MVALSAPPTQHHTTTTTGCIEERHGLNGYIGVKRTMVSMSSCLIQFLMDS